LPAVSLDLWQNFGDDRPIYLQRATVRRAFDLGITHFDLANNYGPPFGSAETNFARIQSVGSDAAGAARSADVSFQVPETRVEVDVGEQDAEY
jgi:diketogulonate reductase-like aldo/keto reductase